jgi:hypothetical protein
MRVGADRAIVGVLGISTLHGARRSKLAQSGLQGQRYACETLVGGRFIEICSLPQSQFACRRAGTETDCADVGTAAAATALGVPA